MVHYFTNVQLDLLNECYNSQIQSSRANKEYTQNVVKTFK